jgi:hypothetical protein
VFDLISRAMPDVVAVGCVIRLKSPRLPLSNLDTQARGLPRVCSLLSSLALDGQPNGTLVLNGGSLLHRIINLIQLMSDLDSPLLVCHWVVVCRLHSCLVGNCKLIGLLASEE